MVTFIKSYYYNLFRSKEGNIPFGLMIMGKPGLWFYRNFPLDLFAIAFVSFFLLWFTFGLTDEILDLSTFQQTGLLFPLAGLVTSLFIFDFIHLSKSLFYNLQYTKIINISRQQIIVFNHINEIFGGKFIIFSIYLFFSIFYSIFNIEFLTFSISIYLLYNYLTRLCSSFLINYDWIKYLIFFSLQIFFLMFYHSTNQSFEEIFIQNENFLNQFNQKYGFMILLLSLILIASDFIGSRVKMR